jgi:hypothetical protein
LQTLKFGITLLVKDLGAKRKSNFFFKRSSTMLKAKVDLHRDDLLINYTTEDSMLMNDMDRMPWRGAREKDARFIQFIIEGTTDEGDLVLDCTASTGEFGF